MLNNMYSLPSGHNVLWSSVQQPFGFTEREAELCFRTTKGALRFSFPPENRPRSFALQLQAGGKKLRFTGDLSRDFKDFPVDAAKECDAVFCELTHFSLEEVLPELKKLPLRRIVFHHVANRYQTPAGEKHVKALLARLPYPAEVASDMQVFEF